MARKSEEKVTLNRRRFMDTIRKAGYVYTDCHGRAAISFNKFREEIIAHYKDTSAGVSQKPLNEAKQGRPITRRTAKNIASFLKVDLDYLTGQQLRPSQEETEKELERRSSLQEDYRIRDCAAFAKRFGWHIVPDQKSEISTVTVMDPDDQVICEKRPVQELYPFLEAAEHLMTLEEDIVFQFLGNMYQKKDLQQ